MKRIICVCLILLLLKTLTLYAAEPVTNDDLIKQNQILREELKKKDLINSKLIRRISVYENKFNSELSSIKNVNQKLNNDLEKNKFDLINTRSEHQNYNFRQNIIFGGLIFIFIAFISISFAFYRKKFIAGLRDNRNSLDHDRKLTELLSNQLTILSHQQNKNNSKADDHTLPIIVGNEIFRMRKRIGNMDESIKGINALKNALVRLEDELNQKGYTIKDLSGHPYTEELMIRISNSIQSKDIEKQKTIISRMIEPIIYYNGVVVSGGEAELALGV